MKRNTTLAIAIIIIFVLLSRSGCEDNNNKLAINTDKIRSEIIDSLNNVYLQREDSILNEKKLKIEEENKRLSSENKHLSKKYNDLLFKYRNTPEIQTEICDTIIESANNVVENQAEIIQNKDSLIEIKDSLLFNCKKNITFKQEMIDRCNSENLALELELKKKNNWWNRNKNWIFFTGGFITGALILK